MLWPLFHRGRKARQSTRKSHRAAWGVEPLEARLQLSAIITRDVHLPGTELYGSDYGADIAVNPADPQELAAVTRNDDTSTIHVDVYHSEDGGVSWSQTTITGDGVDWPVVAYDENGLLYIAYQEDSSDESHPGTQVAVVYSDDNGESLSDPVILYDQNGTYRRGNRPAIATGARGPLDDAQVFCVSYEGVDDYPIVNGRPWVRGGYVDQNGDVSLTAPQEAFPPVAVRADTVSSVAVGPDGQLYLTWSETGYAGAFFTRDVDGLFYTTYSLEQSQSLPTEWDPGDPAGPGYPNPVLAVDRTGNVATDGAVYIAISDGGNETGGISVLRSTSNGEALSWDKFTVEGSQYLSPAIAVDQETGNVVVMYQTGTPAAPHLALSTDEAETWTIQDVGMRGSSFATSVAIYDDVAYGAWTMVGRVEYSNWRGSGQYQQGDLHVATIRLSPAGTESALIERNATDPTEMDVVCDTRTEYAGPFYALDSVIIDGTSGDDDITVDLSGTPSGDITSGLFLPYYGIVHDGGAGSDTLTLIGTSGDDWITLDGSTISTYQYGGQAPITYANVESITVSAGDGADTLKLTGDLSGQSLVFNGQSGNDRFWQYGDPGSAECVFNGGTGDDTLDLDAGDFLFEADANTGTASLHVDVASGATVTFDASQHLASLNVDGDAILTSGGSKVIVTNALTVSTSTGRLELNDNDVILHSDATNYASDLNRLTGLVGNARNSGTEWMGYGIGSSTAANDSSGLTGLGIMGNDYNGYAFRTTFDGETVDRYCILIKYTWNGDADLNGIVNTLDYSRIDRGFMSWGSLSGWQWGDFDYSGRINTLDYALIDAAYLGQNGTL